MLLKSAHKGTSELHTMTIFNVNRLLFVKFTQYLTCYLFRKQNNSFTPTHVTNSLLYAEWTFITNMRLDPNANLNLYNIFPL